MEKIGLCSVLILFFGCSAPQAETYKTTYVDSKKAQIPYLAYFSTAKDANQFGYVWSGKKDKIFVISVEELTKSMKLLFPQAKIVTSDSLYAFVDRYWFYSRYVPYLKLRFPKYSKTFDCDNFSAAVVFYSQWLHNYSHLFDCDSVAVGELYYIMQQDKRGKPHAINIILHKNNNDYSYTFFDINREEEIKLSTKEMNSVWFIKF